jgi:hypothetical protein
MRGVKLLFRCLLLLLAILSPAEASLRTAWQARRELGPGIWSRVLRIENHNRHSRYPTVVYATVFEFADLLWFYTDTDGTQSFSLHHGLLEQEKADFAPLLRAIDAGFERFEEIDAAPEFAGRSAALPNGCFVDSIAALNGVLSRDERVGRAALLSFYAERGGSRVGHTVLAYETARGLFVIDPARRERPAAVARGSLAGDPLQLARQLEPGLELVKARWLVVPLAEKEKTRLPLMASAQAPRDATPATRAEPLG